MSTYSLATEILMGAGLDRLLGAYGIDPGEDPLRAFACGRYPAKKDPAKVAALAGMVPAVLVSAPDRPLRLHASIHHSAGENAGIDMHDGLRPLFKGNLTRGFCNLLLDLMDAPRPVVIYTQAASHDRALSSVAVTLDRREIRVGGEISFVVGVNRIESIMEATSFFPVARVFDLEILRTAIEDAELAGRDGPHITTAGHAKMRKLLGIKGRTPRGEEDTVADRIRDGFEIIMSLPSPSDLSWRLAGAKFDAIRDAEKAAVHKKKDMSDA